jgi:hypothetical protein
MANTQSDLFSYFSDLYKEVNGSRPYGEFFSNLDDWEIQDWCMRLEWQLQEEQDLCEWAEAHMAEEVRWDAMQADPSPDKYEAYC